MSPDFISAYGPFIAADYLLATRLASESATVLNLCEVPPAPIPSANSADPATAPAAASHGFSLGALKSKIHSTTPPAPPVDPSAPPPPRRMLLTVIAIAPHRLGLWSSSQRPEESVLRYSLFDGCPAVVIPVLPGTPLMSWVCLFTFGQVWSSP